LKPVEEKELEKALQKYQMLQNHFTSKTSVYNKMITYPDSRKKTRIVVKKGIENIALPLKDIACFYTENKLVYAIDHSGNKYIADKNLSELEIELDDQTFFRANRQYIINLKYVKGFKPYEKVKLQLDLLPVTLNERCSIIISQEMAPAFRKWIYEA
jgi:DNA-binding LytR/AlgR family response regulator